MSNYLIEVAKKLQALSQSGLTYCKDKYDIERYEELRYLSSEIMNKISHTPIEEIKDLFARETGYATPKVDIRGVVFKDNKVLMVKEELDNKWSLPGGWADVGLSPSEIIVKEIKEEASILTKPKKLLAVLDKKCHPHPPSPYHTYKLFILCEFLSGEICPGIETSDVGFFSLEELPPLSLGRNTRTQIEMIFDFLTDPNKDTIFD
ncbi:NUDIX hydrolase [Clostridium hydrogeniformans]|uniref:NUDIX hydrolase n=1 Tax=Clostridium hydrogeniformans TaxID=349933 RepID=UPI0004848E30|nr:NUDIX hydrolase [Clostridium hydrogeniformans]